MPSARSRPSISLGELAICEDILGGHREYAVDLLSNLEHIRQWHKTDTCPETREGTTCILCELCGADGLRNGTIEALSAYDDIEKRLAAERASLGKTIPTCKAPSRETLFRNDLAKAVLISVVTAGDTLRLQHATWQARLESEISSSLSYAQSPQHTNASPGKLDMNGIRHPLLPVYSGPKVVRSESGSNTSATFTGLLPESTSGSSMFVVVRRCLSSDCPCEANRANVANTGSRSAFRPQVISKAPPSPTDSEKTRASRAVAKSDAGGKHTPRSMITSLERRTRKISGTSDALTKVKANAQTQWSGTCHDRCSLAVRTTVKSGLEGTVLKEPIPSIPASGTKTTSPLTECGTSIADPRVFHLRAQIAQFDDARRALMEWCRTCTADLHLDSGKTPRTGPEMRGSVEGTCGHRSLETLQPSKSVRTMGRVETTTSGDDAVTAQELEFDEQEKLEARWLITRQKRRKDQNGRLSGPYPC